MNSFDTNDPTTIGMLIISVLTIAGVILVSRFLRPIERALAKNTQRAASKTLVAANIAPSLNTKPKTNFGEQPHPEHARSAFTHPSTGPNEEHSGIDHQWSRIADRLDNNIDRIKKASIDHASANTQLLAAEFSLSELFREFPDARDTFNRVTYVEFPGLKSRKSKDESNPADDNIHTASA